MRIVALLFVAVVAEISVLIFVASHIGVLLTLALLLVAALAGGWLLRREGRRTLREFSEAARQRRPPTRELADGVLIAAGALLIALPGLISDVAGLFCLFPPTRALLRRRVHRAAERHSRTMQETIRQQAAAGFGSPGASARRGDDDVIDGEVISVEDDDDTPAGNPRIINQGPASQPEGSHQRRENLM